MYLSTRVGLLVNLKTKKKIFHIKKFLLSLLSNNKIIEDVKGRRIKKKL